MEDNNPIPSQSTTPIVPPSVNAPRPKFKFPIFIMLTVLLFIVAYSAYSYFRYSSYNHGIPPIPMNGSFEPTPTPDPTANWKTYTNTKYMYTIKYPADWLSKKYEDGKYYEPTNNAKYLNLYPPVKPCPAHTNQFTCETSENISIYVYENPDNLSIESFNFKMEAARGPAAEEAAKMISYQPISINDVEGLISHDTWKLLADSESKTSVGSETVYFKRENRIYSIWYNKFDWVQKKISPEEFHEVLSTFKFTDQNSTIDTSNWKTYTNSFGKFSFKIPQGWITKPEIISNTFYTQYIQSADYAEKPQTEPGMAITNISNGSSIYIHLEKNANFQSYEDFRNFEENKSTEFNKNSYDNGQEILIDGVRSMIIEYGSKSLPSIKGAAYTYRDGMIYDIAFNNTSGDLSLFKQILSTFKFTN